MSSSTTSKTSAVATTRSCGTMVLAMRACARARKAFCVLDRPNPIGGVHIEGGVSRAGLRVVRRLVSCRTVSGDDGRRDRGVAARRREARPRSVRHHDARPGIATRATSTPACVGAAVAETMRRSTPRSCIRDVSRRRDGAVEGRGTTRPFELAGCAAPRRVRPRRAADGDEPAGVRFRPCVFTPQFRNTRRRRAAASSCTSSTPTRSARTSRHRVPQGVPRPSARQVQVARARVRVRRQDSGDRLLTGGDAIRKGIEAGASLDELSARWPRDEGTFADSANPFLLYT